MSKLEDTQKPADAAPIDANDVRSGMIVEATDGDLGGRDVTKPKVRGVVRDAWGNVTKIVIKKGLLFKKQLAIPAERIAEVEPTPKEAEEHGKVVIEADGAEIERLTAQGAEELAAEGPQSNGLISELEDNVPTVEGLRRKESRYSSPRHMRPQEAAARPAQQPAMATSAGEEEEIARQEGTTTPAPHFSLRTLGPGLLAGMAGNDSSAVTSYSVTGATTGYNQLWLLLLATPLYQAVQFACATIGRVTQRGLADLLRTEYGKRVAVPVSLLLIIANGALIAADLAAIGSGLQLVTGITWIWFVVPTALILWYLTVYQSFGIIKRIFLGMSLAFVAYLITGVFSGAHWGDVLRSTFIPQISLDFAGISSAVALLGATISPYTMYWQVQGEKEEDRPGPRKTQLKLAAIDIASGTISGNLVAYFIIICTSATLFTHHKQIQTAADAARALAPLAGPFAKYLFAIGLVGAGLVAIPVLLASTSYAVAGTFGWPASLWKKPWQNEGFYLILTVALVVSLVLALLGFDPIQLMFWANVLQGTLSPVLIVLIIVTGNNRKMMKRYCFSRKMNLMLGLMALIMFVATALLVYGLLTGRA